MANIINSKLTKIIPEETLLEIASDYKAFILLNKGEQKPQLWKLFRDKNIKRDVYEKFIGTIGNTESVHEFLGRQVELHVDDFTELLRNTIAELLARTKNMTNQELINLAGVLAKLNAAPETTHVNNQIVFDIDKHLANRLDY